MSVSVPRRPAPLPIPPNYMRAVEQKQVREMYAPLDRPAGDLRSAQQIIDQSPVMTHFLQGRDSYAIADDLKQQVGDWTHPTQTRMRVLTRLTTWKKCCSFSTTLTTAP